MASLAMGIGLNDQDYLRLLAAEPEEEEEELQEAEEEDLEEELQGQEYGGGAYIQFDAMDFATALGHELRRYPSLLELHQFLNPNPNPAVAGAGDDEDGDLASALKETASDGSACPICLLDDNENEDDDTAKGAWKKTACGHKFHGPCIEKWLSAKGSCPLCRRQLVKTTKPPTTVAPEDLDLVWNDLLGLYGEELVADLSFVEFQDDQNLG